MDSEIGPGELRQRAVSGIFWSVSSISVRQVIGLVTGVLLARLLFPSDFGLVAMVQVFTGVAVVLFEIGIAGALIQAKTIDRSDCDSIFWLNLGMGGLLTLLFALLGPLVADLYSEPRLRLVVAAMSLVFVLDALGTVHRVLLIRNLEFRKLGRVEVCSITLTNAAAVTAALFGYGYWSLVFQTVLSSLTFALLVWPVIGWRPHLAFSVQSVRRLFRFGSTAAGSRLLTYAARNLDILVIGTWIGSTGLGYFNFSFRVMVFPVWSIVGVISRVMFSLMSKLQEEKGRVSSIYLRVNALVAAVVFPVLIGIIATAESFVPAVPGTQWQPMVPILRLLCLVGIFDSVTTTTGQLYLSQGKAGLFLKVNLGVRLLCTLGVVIGLGWGVTGAALGMAVTAAVSLYPALRFACSIVGLPVSRVFAGLFPSLVCSLGMGIPTWFLGRSLIGSGTPAVTVLAVQVLCGAILYLVLVWIFDPGQVRSVLALLLEAVRQRFDGSEGAPSGNGTGDGQAVGIFDVGSHRDAKSDS